jgi:anti-sigma-K factor RskA
MRYDDPNLRDTLAAEYALGTLRGAARRRFVRLVSKRVDWQQSVDWWTSRINLIGLTVKEEKPSSRIWRNIEAKLFTKAPTSISWWRSLAVVSSALVIVLSFVLGNNLLQQPAEPVTAEVALLANEEAKPGWILSFNKNSKGEATLRTTALASLAPISEKSYELWILPPDKSAPISLGVLPNQGEINIALNAALAKLAKDGALAVTLEQLGGTPDGKPKGPVVYQGKLAQI